MKNLIIFVLAFLFSGCVSSPRVPVLTAVECLDMSEYEFITTSTASSAQKDAEFFKADAICFNHKEPKPYATECYTDRVTLITTCRPKYHYYVNLYRRKTPNH